MENMDGWDVALLVLVAYVAIRVLVRLMIRHRDEMLARLRDEVQRAKKAKTTDEKTVPDGGRRRAG